jgi:uncharacterized protein YqgC (DUF456 family)
MIQQEENGVVAGGQVLAAVGILVGLALTAPLLGLLMVPFAAANSIARAARG